MRQSLMILALATAVGSTYSCSSTKSGEKVGGTGAGTSTGGVSGGLNLGNGGSGIAAATGSGASPGTGASGNTGGLSGVTGTPGVRLSDGTCSAISSADAGCVGTTYVGEQIPVDIYIMFDVSRSMCSDVTVAPPPAGSPWPADCTTAPCTAGTASCCDLNPNPGPTDVDYQKITPGSKSRWSAERNALQAFLNDPASAGLGVGIGYFGYQCLGATSCDPTAYATPAVTIAPLPGNAAPIVSSLDGHPPTGETPTGAAIRGMCQYARSWKQQNPGHVVVNLLVTDGIPEAPTTSNFGALCGSGACCPTAADASQAATDCAAGTTGIKTYVLGVGPSLTTLNQIAAAGGTNQAYLVEGGDVQQQVLSALRTIRGDVQIPCEFQVPTAPSGMTVDYQQVNLIYADSACTSYTIYNVTSVSTCNPSYGGGWYYDNPNTPSKISLCPSTCGAVSAPGSQFQMSVGCATQIIPVQ